MPTSTITGFNTFSNPININRDLLFDNLYLGLSSRGGVKWGDGITLKLDTTDDITSYRYICFYQSTAVDTAVKYIVFKIKNIVGTSILVENLVGSGTISYSGSWSFVVDNSQNFYDLIPTSTTYNKVFLYKTGTPSAVYTIQENYNISNNSYKDVISCKLSTTNNGIFSNIDPDLYGSNLTMYNYGDMIRVVGMNKNVITKIKNGNLDISNLYFYLINDSNTIYSGLKFKSLYSINDINTAMVFEYQCFDKTRTVIITDEFKADSKILLFPDVDYSNFNLGASEERHPPIPYELVGGGLFKDMLLINSPFSGIDNVLTEDVINNNKIDTDGIYYIANLTNVDNNDKGVEATVSSTLVLVSGMSVLTGSNYATWYVTTSASLAKKYNIRNIYVFIPRIVEAVQTNYKFYNVNNTGLKFYSGTDATDFRLRELCLFYKNSTELIPAYYMRLNATQITTSNQIEIIL